MDQGSKERAWNSGKEIKVLIFKGLNKINSFHSIWGYIEGFLSQLIFLRGLMLSFLVMVDGIEGPIFDLISFLDSKDIGREGNFFFSGLDIMFKNLSIRNIIRLISHEKCKGIKEKEEDGEYENSCDNFFGMQAISEGIEEGIEEDKEKEHGEEDGEVEISGGEFASESHGEEKTKAESNRKEGKE